jgi:DNA polymerase I-like protein with 3'-5' exonuclease and polymerase domains
MRDIFVCEPDMWIVSADKRQLEARIEAMFSGDPLMCQIFNDDDDIHWIVAEAVLGAGNVNKPARDKLKNVTYARAYGGGEEVIADTLMKKGIRIERNLIRKTLEVLEKLFARRTKWQREQLAETARKGYVECKLSGRRVEFHGERPDPTVTANYPMQAGAAQMMNEAILNIDKEVRWDSTEYIHSQVHDEINLVGNDAHRLYDILAEHLSEDRSYDGVDMKFPCEIAIGKDWYNLKEVNSHDDVDRVIRELTCR